jgi:Domain of unknown function (DUF4398)
MPPTHKDIIDMNCPPRHPHPPLAHQRLGEQHEPAQTPPAVGTRGRWFLLLALTALAACATVPAPTAEMAVAEAAVVNATQAGALQWAPAEMRSAQAKLARARSAMASKEHGQALTLAHEVHADAQLAAVAARASKAQRAADEVQEANRVLREELARKQTRP